MITMSGDFGDFPIDITRIQYTLTFSGNLAQQYLDGNYTSTFLIGSTEQPEAQRVFSLMQNFAQDDEDEAQFWATSGDIHLARPLPTVNPPVSAIPLPPAFSAGLGLLGRLGVIGILHQRRRAMA